jgi:threonine dehydratase
MSTVAATLTLPTITDVLHARRRISPYLPPTPLFRYPGLSALLGTDVWVKHENHQPIAAFKVRGGINLISQLSEAERAAGVISASTGNHGQSVAYAAHLFDVPATICVPEGANPVKVASMRSWGATVIHAGRDFDDAREHCERLAREEGYRYIHSGDEPLLIASVGTATLEVLEDCPEIDVLIVPIGGGSGAAGACIVARALKPSLRVIGVQSAQAPTAYQSWSRRQLVEASNTTSAEGLATRTAFALPQRILWEQLDEFILVDDAAIQEATRTMIEQTKNLVEPAGASPLAAAVKLRDQLAGKRVALMCTGGNISPAQLGALFSTHNN